MTSTTYRKERPDAPPGFFACEAAGLRWLAVPGGPRVVEVLGVDADGIDLERLVPGPASPGAAEAFGAALAQMHSAGADAFGSPAEGWTGDGFFGPLEEPLPLLQGCDPAWGGFYAERRLRQVRDLLAERGRLSAATGRHLDRVSERLRAGAWDDGEPPARAHGDLWTGNVMWTADGAVLIDPAAHGGHRLTDLAMLDLFGLPHLDRAVGAYQEVHPLPAGWRELVGLHQIYPVGMHAVLFGGGYVPQLEELVARYA